LADRLKVTFQLLYSDTALKPLPTHLIDDNPFNPRKNYEEFELRSLSNSLEKNGLLCPVCVRENQGRYQLVYGHRRVRAARLLNWATIAAEIGDFSDQQMLELSLVENVQRHDLTDYETAASFRRLNVEFRKTYEEIGRLFGFSKSHVCNMIAMLDLFSESALNENSRLRSNLLKISEHHSRILSRISDMQMRARMLELTVTQGLSVRELQKIVGTLRGWFNDDDASRHESIESNGASDADAELISDLLAAAFILPRKGDFQKYLAMHAFDQLSVYDDFAPYERLEDDVFWLIT
jgi:ParB/RepB/Spo0J family partition protein